MNALKLELWKALKGGYLVSLYTKRYAQDGFFWNANALIREVGEDYFIFETYTASTLKIDNRFVMLLSELTIVHLTVSKLNDNVAKRIELENAFNKAIQREVE